MLGVLKNALSTAHTSLKPTFVPSPRTTQAGENEAPSRLHPGLGKQLPCIHPQAPRPQQVSPGAGLVNAEEGGASSAPQGETHAGGEAHAEHTVLCHPGCSPPSSQEAWPAPSHGPFCAGSTCLVLTCFHAPSVTMIWSGTAPSWTTGPSGQHCPLQRVHTSTTCTLASGSPQWEVGAGMSWPAALQGNDVESQAGLPLPQDQPPALPTSSPPPPRW